MRLVSLALSLALASVGAVAACGVTAEQDPARAFDHGYGAAGLGDGGAGSQAIATEPEGGDATTKVAGRSASGGSSDLASGGAGGALGESPSGDDTPLTDDEVRLLLIAESIDSYDGHCPCPYSIASDGSECGGRSAYSRVGGANPLCFIDDVTDEMVRAWRDEHPGR